jgi:hypothetical protein
MRASWSACSVDCDLPGLGVPGGLDESPGLFGRRHPLEESLERLRGRVPNPAHLEALEADALDAEQTPAVEGSGVSVAVTPCGLDLPGGLGQGYRPLDGGVDPAA